MRTSFRGTGVALATPMKADHSIDFQGFDKLIEHVIAGGVDYVVLMGTTGESPTISWDEKLELLNHLSKKLDGKIPLVFGHGGNNTAELIQQVKKLKGMSIDAILSASPYYNKPSQEGIYQHYNALADASSFPVILYNVPHRTASTISAETTLRLAQHKNIIGIKEASSDLLQCGLIARDKPADFLLISGDDFITLPIMAIGGEGVISVVANAYPQVTTEIIKAALNGNFSLATELHLGQLETLLLTVKEGNPSSIKGALKSLGICESFVRLPLVPASAELVRQFQELKA